MTDKILILCNCASPEEAGRIARSLVAKRLAACVNIIPAIRSIYRWQGAIEDATEHTLLIKTQAALYPSVESEIRSLHSYEVPEVIATPIQQGSAAYLNWIAAETTPE